MSFFTSSPSREPSQPIRVPADLGQVVPATASPSRFTARRPWRIAAWILAGAAAAAFAGVASVLVWYTITIPNPMAKRVADRVPVVRVLARDRSVLMERGQPADYIPFDLLPKHVVDALVAVEDRRFFSHIGVDAIGLLRAAAANLRAGRLVQGGSTLSQQLAKNLFLTSERSIDRKLDELMLALWLELRLSKQDIVELYLNRVYFGGGAYGIEAATQRFFGKSARDLTLPEAAVLAGLLKAPSKLSPNANPAPARSRGRLVLSAMRETGSITPGEEAAARRIDVAFRDQASGEHLAGVEYAVDYILERLPQNLGALVNEIVVVTTIDAALQKRTQRDVAALLRVEGEASEVTQAAAVVLDFDGAILAMVGGQNYAQSQFNRAAKAKRQPGSAFKPFVFAAAIEAGATPETEVMDGPFVINGWSPRNEGGGHRGSITLRTALAHSVNTAAARLHIDHGPARTAALARRLGITSELRPNPTLALGTSEVTLLELTAAYGAFANGGSRLDPYVISEVRTGTGALLFQRPERAITPVLAPRTAGQMVDMLESAVTSGTGRRAALARHASAGKTGTSQDYRDAWFAGFTGHLVGGVWLGNDNGKPMNRIMGGTLPARLWADIMTTAHEQRVPLPLVGLKPRPRLSPGREPGLAGGMSTLRRADRFEPPARMLTIRPEQDRH